jgi:hypothetical protein
VFLTKAYVGFPALTLAQTMCLPIAPVGPRIKILFSVAIGKKINYSKKISVCVSVFFFFYQRRVVSV